MARKKEMCSSENHEPDVGIVLMKLEERHSFEGHPLRVERNQELVKGMRMYCVVCGEKKQRLIRRK